MISGHINPSIRADNPKDARAGDGQYFSDISPSSTTPTDLARKFKNVPNRYLYTHYIELDVKGLVIKKYGDHLYVHNSSIPLYIGNRVKNFGKV